MTLDQAQQRTRAARDRLTAAQAAVYRARTVAADAQAALSHTTDAEAEVIAAHAGRIEAWVAAGSDSPAPQLIADATLLQQKVQADGAARAAASALANLEHAQAVAAADLAGAERQLEAVCDALMVERGDAMADELNRLRERVRELETQLRALGALVDLSPIARAAAGDELHMSIEELQVRFERQHARPEDTALAIETAAEHWRSERAALMQNETLATHSVAA